MHWRHDPRWAYALVNLSALLWASNILLGRVLRADVGPVTLTAARFLVAGLIFAVISRRWQALEPSPRRDGWRLLLLGLLGVFAFPSLLYLALQRTSAINVALINGTSPLITVFLSALFLRERSSPAILLGGLISLAGVTLVISGGSIFQSQGLEINSGDLIALLTAGIWGVYSVLGRGISRSRSTFSMTAFSTWFALPLLIPAAALEWQSAPPNLTWQLLLAVLYIAIFPTVVAFLSWNEGVRQVGPNQAMAFYNMLPVFGALLGWGLLGETLNWTHIVGGGLVIAGGLLVARQRRRLEPLPIRTMQTS